MSTKVFMQQQLMFYSLNSSRSSHNHLGSFNIREQTLNHPFSCFFLWCIWANVRRNSLSTIGHALGSVSSSRIVENISRLRTKNFALKRLHGLSKRPFELTVTYYLISFYGNRSAWNREHFNLATPKNKSSLSFNRHVPY